MSARSNSQSPLDLSSTVTQVIPSPRDFSSPITTLQAIPTPRPIVISPQPTWEDQHGGGEVKPQIIAGTVCSLSAYDTQREDYQPEVVDISGDSNQEFSTCDTRDIYSTVAGKSGHSHVNTDNLAQRHKNYKVADQRAVNSGLSLVQGHLHSSQQHSHPHTSVGRSLPRVKLSSGTDSSGHHGNSRSIIRHLLQSSVIDRHSTGAPSSKQHSGIDSGGYIGRDLLGVTGVGESSSDKCDVLSVTSHSKRRTSTYSSDQEENKDDIRGLEEEFFPPNREAGDTTLPFSWNEKKKEATFPTIKSEDLKLDIVSTYSLAQPSFMNQCVRKEDKNITSRNQSFGNQPISLTGKNQTKNTNSRDQTKNTTALKRSYGNQPEFSTINQTAISPHHGRAPTILDEGMSAVYLNRKNPRCRTYYSVDDISSDSEEEGGFLPTTVAQLNKKRGHRRGASGRNKSHGLMFDVRSAKPGKMTFRGGQVSV